MILTGLYHYLTYAGDLPGHAADLFAAAQKVDGREILSRNDARRAIRDQVGNAVYEAAIPQTPASVVSAITLRGVTSDTEQALVGETGTASDLIELQIWTRGPHAPHRARVLGRLARIALSGYYGWLETTKETWSQDVAIERDGEFVTPPQDASDTWPHYLSMDLRCHWVAPSPVYPDTILAAIATVRAVPGGHVVSAKASHVPEGRPLQTVAIACRDAKNGNIVKQWSGVPAAVVSGVAGVSGLNIEAIVSGLPSSGWVDVTITDKNGNQSTTGVPYVG